MIGNIGKMQYPMILEQIKRKMKEGKKVKPIKPIDNDGGLSHGEIPKKKNNKKQTE
jgi:hypothetical protein